MHEAAAGLMTVEQYCEEPEPGSFYYELHHGELVRVSWLKFGDAIVRRRIWKQLDAALDGHGIVMTGMSFRALPEYELRVADVGYITRERWKQIKDEDYCLGAPDLIIEVLSRSTRRRERRRQRRPLPAKTLASHVAAFRKPRAFGARGRWWGEFRAWSNPADPSAPRS
jgi:Uma2 family endonuclease